MNSCNFMGRITKDIEVHRGQNGGIAIAFDLAVRRRFKKEGEKDADFLHLKAFGKTAELIEKYCTKGSLICVQSNFRNENYTNRNGDMVYKDVFIVDAVDFCDSKKSANQGGNDKPKAQQSQDDFMRLPVDSAEEVPFD